VILVLEDLVIQVVRIRVRVKIRGSKGICLVTVPKIIEDRVALRIKRLRGVGVERSKVASDVDKRGIMQTNVRVRGIFVSTVGNRVILLGIAKPQRPGRRQMWHKEFDPLLEEVLTVWALE
jgi:hypothetical protein